MALYLTYILSKGMYLGVVSAISAATKNTCEFIGTMYMYENPDINKVFRELDIIRRLHTIELFIRKQYFMDISNLHNDDDLPEQFMTIGVDPMQETDPIRACLLYIEDTINNINGILYQVDEKLRIHNQKWLHKWRDSDIATLIDDIHIESKQLDSRFDDLVKLSRQLTSKKID